jgi:hypothetical protein
MLIRSLIFLAFEQKKKIKELEQGSYIYQKKTVSNIKANNSISSIQDNSANHNHNHSNNEKSNQENQKSADKSSRIHTHTNVTNSIVNTNSNTFNSSTNSKSFKVNTNSNRKTSSLRSSSNTKTNEIKSNNNKPGHDTQNVIEKHSTNKFNNTSSNNIRTIQRNSLTPNKNMRKSVDSIDKKGKNIIYILFILDTTTKNSSTCDPKKISKSPVKHTRASSVIGVTPFTNTSTPINSKATTNSNSTTNSTTNSKLPPKYVSKTGAKK